MEADLVFVTDTRRVLRRIGLDRFDVDNPDARELLLATTMSIIDENPRAYGVAVEVGGDVENMLRLRDFRLDDPDGVRSFAEELFQTLDDLEPPPQSGLRLSYRPNETG